MEATKVLVVDVEEADSKGIATSLGATVQILQNTSSIPVTVYVYPTPASSLVVNLVADLGNFEEDSSAAVDIFPESLTFGPWDDEGFTFTATASNMNSGDVFEIGFTFSGANMDSYDVDSSDPVPFEVITSASLASPTVTIDAASASVE